MSSLLAAWARLRALRRLSDVPVFRRGRGGERARGGGKGAGGRGHLRGALRAKGEAWKLLGVAVASAERSAASSEVLEEEDKGGGGGLGRVPLVGPVACRCGLD